MSKYDPLCEYLSGRSENAVTLGFAEIERILGDDLPDSARRHRPWWGNDQQHTQGKRWLAVGWEVGECSLPDEWVTFIRQSVGDTEL